MSKAKRYFWIRLKKDFFKRHDIRIVEEMPNGKDYILFYLKLLVESVGHEGELRFSETIPYNEEMLAIVTNTNVDIVRAAMRVFIELKMIEVWDDETIYLADIRSMVGSESESAPRVRKHRNNAALLPGELRSELRVPVTAPPPKTNAERQRNSRAKAACKKVDHVPIVEDYVNNARYWGNYFIVIRRDGFKCKLCGSIERICVRHIDGFDENNSWNSVEEKLITLCASCDYDVNGGKEIPKDVLMDIGYPGECLSGGGVTITCNTELELDKELELEVEEKRVTPKNVTGGSGQENNHDHDNNHQVLESTKQVNKENPFGLTDAEIENTQKALLRVEDAAVGAGLSWSLTNLQYAERLIVDYTEDWVVSAIERVSLRAANKQSWGAVAGILKSWKDKGGIDNPEYKGPDDRGSGNGVGDCDDDGIPWASYKVPDEDLRRTMIR